MSDPTIRVKQTLDNSQFQSKLKQSQGMAGQFKKSVMAIGPAMAAAFTVGAIASYTKEAMNLAGQMVGVREAFMRIADDATLDKLKEATRGTVSEMELMKNAVKANNFKIPLTQLATFFEFATKRAAQTGESVQYLVESIILGIGRKSPLILDNLGISAIELREKLKGVGMESASVADVTKAMGEIIEGEMVRMGDVTETAGQKMERLKASSEDMKTAWGELANTISTMVAPALTSLATGMKDALEGTQALADEETLSFWDKFLVTLYASTNNAKSLGRVLGKNLNPELKETKDNLDDLDGDGKPPKVVVTLNSLKQALAELQETQANAPLEMFHSYDAEIKKLKDQIALYEVKTEKVKKTKDELAKLQEQIAEGKLKAELEFDIEVSKIGQEDREGLAGQIGDLETGDQLNFDDIAIDTEQADAAIAEWERYTAAVEENAQRIQGAMEQIGSAVGQALGEFIKGEAKFADVAAGLLQTIIKIVAGYLTESVAASFAGGASAGGPAAPFTGAAAAAAALSMFGALVPALMAEGGTVPGGYPGDTYPALLTSGETVVPPHKLDMMRGSQTVKVVGMIRGNDIHFINEKMTSKKARYGGV